MTDDSPRGPTVGRERATLDELFEVLSDASRRRILTALADAKFESASPRTSVSSASGSTTLKSGGDSSLGGTPSFRATASTTRYDGA